MSKVVLVGHCGPDATYLRMAVKAAGENVALSSVDDNAGLEQALKAGVDLVLFNRELDYGFEPATGVEMIRMLKQRYPQVRMMLISNYPEAQAAAVTAGAIPGFGKREIGSARVKQLLRDLMSAETKT
jgi:two-component system, chemotaxis family, chemotaxis protein CheY